MNFAEWEPIYHAICADFGFDRSDDERARDVLESLLEAGETAKPEHLALEGETVAIAGAGPNLTDEADLAAAADTVIAASSAAATLTEAGVAVDCVVTDLDGTPETATRLATEGTLVVIHAHGDNVPALREYVPEMPHASVLPTTQAEPTDRVWNFGGFTDGDRAAFLADHCGATRLAFPGWQFEDSAVGPEKQQKLRWAGRLLAVLERRRREKFSVLDPVRDDLDPI